MVDKIFSHELAHLVLHVPESIDEEKAAFRSAGAFLAPDEVLYREVGRKRAFIQAAESLLLKQEEDGMTMLGESMQMKGPASLVERRACMKLPLVDRRKIMARQAKEMAAHSEKDG
jgi:hypothetical protein